METTNPKSRKHEAEDLRRSFGKYIQQHRVAKGYTQQQLADLLGVTPKTISCTERGETFPGYENIFRLAMLLDMSLDQFVLGSSSFQDELRVPEINAMLQELDWESRRIIFETVKAMCKTMMRRR